MDKLVTVMTLGYRYILTTLLKHIFLKHHSSEFLKNIPQTERKIEILFRLT